EERRLRRQRLQHRRPPPAKLWILAYRQILRHPQGQAMCQRQMMQFEEKRAVRGADSYRNGCRGTVLAASIRSRGVSDSWGAIAFGSQGSGLPGAGSST